MAKSQKVISIPKPPASAFNKHRPVSELLWMQVEHLAAVVKKDIDDERRAIRTEGEASDFIKKYTALLHPDGARKRVMRSPKAAGKKPTRSSKR
ncbi:MAG: hypothetical protein DMF60_06965 [Acidobacteria bacterium]|nr:MAG: hypothetical protein DMF60_06965 [Acidobacteriota bacterium]